MTNIKSVEWLAEKKDSIIPGCVRILDQTLLPSKIAYIETTDINVVWTAIKTLQVRGAPAIGIAAAMGLAAAFQKIDKTSSNDIMDEFQRLADYLATSRPTAVNLFWAIKRMKNTAEKYIANNLDDLKENLVKEAIAIRDEDAAMCRAIGDHGAKLLKTGDTILTHCNAGGLATSEYGTALAPVYTAAEQGKTISVYADETRPLLQGARLTTWELMQANIDVTLICDNTAAQVMKEGLIDAVLVGADRIAANGDAANKIGTYGLAVLAKAHNIPFYVLAPTSTIDPNTPNGAAIPIEERESHEVTEGFGKLTAPNNAKVYSPAFDVTPAELITGIICEKGIATPDFSTSLANFLSCRF